MPAVLDLEILRLDPNSGTSDLSFTTGDGTAGDHRLRRLLRIGLGRHGVGGLSLGRGALWGRRGSRDSAAAPASWTYGRRRRRRSCAP